MTTETCSIEGCEKPKKYKSSGWCQAHYHRWWRHGSPYEVVQPRGGKAFESVNYKGDDITYRTAHWRVSQAKGRASEHVCEDCGQQATHWSYDHTDMNEKTELVNGHEVEYSADVNCYQPLCRGCHIKRDRWSMQ